MKGDERSVLFATALTNLWRERRGETEWVNAKGEAQRRTEEKTSEVLQRSRRRWKYDERSSWYHTAAYREGQGDGIKKSRGKIFVCFVQMMF